MIKKLYVQKIFLNDSKVISFTEYKIHTLCLAWKNGLLMICLFFLWEIYVREKERGNINLNKENSRKNSIDMNKDNALRVNMFKQWPLLKRNEVWAQFRVFMNRKMCVHIQIKGYIIRIIMCDRNKTKKLASILVNGVVVMAT